jgi:chromosome segregation protein
MRLKKLEIKGFKSFAANTVIHFSERVTGVVGPNGSGKSNVVDAIRWVLGEQKSRDLRLEKMSDVLFNGTSKRKKSHVAQVSITFENDRGLIPLEYSEVTVSRILYRSGQSEYRLNNVPCRLKDITSLLADTGIGSNSYAIIELGMVDDILSDKDDSRRRMFEQAAGIYHFKKRKHETNLKLKATNEDLERVQDLLFEIETNLKQLEKQARRAKRYLKLKDNYRNKALVLAAHSILEYKDRYEQLKAKITQNQDEHNGIISKINTSGASIEKRKKDLLGLETDLSAIQRQLAELNTQISDSEHKINLNKQEIHFSSQVLDREEQSLDSSAERKEIIKERIGQCQHELKKSGDDLEIKAAQLDKTKVVKGDLEDGLSSKRTEHSFLLNEQIALSEKIGALEKDIAVLANKIENNKHRIASQQKLKLDKETRLIMLDEEFSIRNSEREKIESGVNKSQDLLKEAIKRKDDLNSQIEQKKDELLALNRRFDARENERDLLKNMIDNLEGYPDSIKFLAQEIKWANNPILLSDIINCDDEYKRAVEAVLEPFLNHYIVNGRDEALRAIHLLRDAQKGRASFINLSAFDKIKTSKVEAPAGCVSAIDVVSFNPAFEPLVSNLLHNVFIATTELNKQPASDISIVSISGDIIQSDKILSGGSMGLFDGKKLGRKESLDRLQKVLQKLSKKKDKTSDELKEMLRERSELDIAPLQEQFELREKELNECLKDITRIQITKTELEKGIAHDSEVINHLEQELLIFDGGSKAEKSELKEIRVAYDKLIEKMSGSTDKIDHLSAELNDKSMMYNSANVEYVNAKNAFDNKQAEIVSLQNQIVEIDKSTEDRKTHIAEMKDKIQENRISIQQLEDALNVLYDKRTKGSESLGESEKVFFKAKNEIYESEKALSLLNRKANDINFLINESKDKYNEVRLKINEVSQRSKVEFNVETAELISMEIDESVELDPLSEEVEKLRYRLYNFGEVNPLAVEAFQEIQERYDNICSQRDDILEAQKSLLETIAELEVQATRQFMEAFDVVRDNFVEIFRTLFRSEDNCDLILLDPENPLTSKVDVIAKPKGKRPLSLSQLSGGEKTLTATALLFALYLLKPAPFCIFDEVDAPLDDSNIEKFNNIISRFSRGSQFVIITHNKLTMAAVDVIYGVYMDQPGISSVTPVDFRALKHEALPLELTQN